MKVFLNSSTLASLRFFAVAARVLSFKQAAIELHVTQGAVSQHVKQLEEALGVKLFYRLVRQIALTDEGVRFATLVQRALDDIQRGAQEITATRGTVDVHVRANASFSLLWLVPRLGDFYAKHSRIRLFVNAAHGTFDPGRREFDLAIELARDKIRGMHSDLLVDEYLAPVCTPEYLKKHPLKRPKDVERRVLLHDGEAWIGAAEDAEWRHWLDGVGATAVESATGQFFSLSNMSIGAALTHQGVAMGRLSLIQELLESRRLVMPFTDTVRSPASYYLLSYKDAAESPGVREVVWWLREQAQGGRALADLEHAHVRSRLAEPKLKAGE